jgi:hypothetical protein
MFFFEYINKINSNMKKLVRESINEANIYGKPWVTDTTWEYINDDGEITETPIPISDEPEELDEPEGKYPEKEWKANFPGLNVQYDDLGYPYLKNQNYLIRPKGFLLMNLLQYMKDNPGMRYTEMQQILYDAGHGLGYWWRDYEKSKYTNSLGKKEVGLRGYSSINLKRYKDNGYFEPRYTSPITTHRAGWQGHSKVTRSKDTKYYITPYGESKLQQLRDQLNKYRR